MLGSGGLWFIEFGERLALLGELLQERRRRPDFAVLLLEFADSFVNGFQANGVRIPHGTTAIAGESVAVQVNDVDIDGTQSIALFEDTSAFVHERIKAAIDDFFSRDLALGNPCFGGPLPYQLSHFGVGKGAPLFVIFVPAGAGFLPITPQLAKFVFGERLANTGLLQVTIFFADAPADIETREISCGQWPHCHAEVVKRFIHGLDASALFNEKLRFATVRAEHAVAYKARAIADENADFPEPFRKLHAGRDDFLACRLAPYDFEQTHDVGRAKEMRSDHRRRPRGSRCDFINAQRGGVGCKNGAGPAHTIEFSKYFFLEGHAFEDGFDDHVHTGEAIEAEGRFDELQALINVLLREAAALHGIRVILLNVGKSAIQGRAVHFLQENRNSSVGKNHGDSSAHGSGPYNGNVVYGKDGRFLGDIRDLGDFPFTEENVNEGSGLIREKTFEEKLLLSLTAFFKRQFRRGFHGVDGGERGHHPALLLARGFPSGGENGSVLLRSAELVFALACFRRGLSRNFAREGDGTGQEIAINQTVENSRLQGVLRLDGIAFRAHLHGLCDSGKARKPLRSRGARDEAKLHFRLADLRVRNSDAVMSGHRQLQAAAEGSSVNGHNQRFAAIFDL